MVVPIKLKLGSSKSHASTKAHKPDSAEAKSTAEAKASQEALPKSEKPDSFVTSHQAFMGGNKSSFETDPVTGRIKNFKKDPVTGSRFKENLDESPTPVGAGKPVNEPAKLKRSSWFKSRRESSTDDSASVSSSSLMESRRSSSWFSRSRKDSDADSLASTSSSYSRSSSSKDSDASSMTSTKSDRSWSSWRSKKDSDSASVTTVGSQDSPRSTGLGGYFRSKWSRKSQSSIAPQDIQAPKNADPFAEIKNLHKQEISRLKGSNDPYVNSIGASPSLSRAEWNNPQVKSEKPYASDMNQLGALTPHNHAWEPPSNLYEKAGLAKKPENLAQKEEKPAVNDMNQLGSLMPHESWAPPTNLYENAGWAKSSTSLKSNESHGTPFSKDDSDAKTLYEEPLPVANGFHGYSPANTTPDYHQELKAFDSQSKRNSWSSETSTLHDQPIGKSDFKEPPTTKNPYPNDSISQSKSVDIAPKGLSAEEEKKWDNLSDEYFASLNKGIEFPKFKQDELNALNAKSITGEAF